MRNIAYIKVATTGLDPSKHGIIQLACIIEQNDKILEEINLYMKPIKGDLLSREALKINNIAVEDFKTKKYLYPSDAYKQFIEFLDKHVDKFDREDKLILCGKNIQFDISFLKTWFEKFNNSFFNAYFHKLYIDLNTKLAELMLHNDDLIIYDFSIEKICEMCDIEIENRHCAYEIVNKLVKYFNQLTDEQLKYCLREIKEMDETGMLKGNNIFDIASEISKNLDINYSNSLDITKREIIRIAAFKWLETITIAEKE